MKKWIGLTALTMLTIFNQNCSIAVPESESNSSLGGLVVESIPASPDIKYDPELTRFGSSANPILNISSDLKIVVLESPIETKSCALDALRSGLILAALNGAKLCKPKQIPENILCSPPLETLFLKYSDDEYALAGGSPNNFCAGFYLCDGREDNLRAILDNILLNPPPGCD